MAVTVTDNRTILYQDSLTNITGASTASTSFYAEASGSAAEAYNIATGQIYWSGTTPNFTTAGNELIYVWSAVVATQNGYKEATAADSSHAMYLSDGTNALLIYQAGNDRDVFKHAEGQVSFQCFVVDIDYLSTMNTNGDLAVTAGTFASFNSASTSMDVGAHYTTLSKALGGGQNCYLDIIRYGGTDDGLQITGGTTGDRGTYQEVCVEDRADTDGKAHGIIREYTIGAYGAQGTLRHGDTGTASTYFEESNFTLTFEDRLVGEDKYKLVVEGNSTGTNVYNISNATISSARPGVTVDMSSNNINELNIDGCTFVNLLNSFSLPTDTNGTTRDHNVTNSTFNNVGTISIGSTAFTNNVINNSNGTSAITVALDGTGSTTIPNLTLNSGGSGHGLELTGTVETVTLSNVSFSGYAASNGSTGNEAIYVNIASGSITINYTTGAAPSVRTAGATVTVTNSIVITFSGLPSGINARLYLGSPNSSTSATLEASEDNITDGTFAVTTGNGGSTAYAVFINLANEYKILDFPSNSLPTATTTIPVTFGPDRVYIS